MVYVAGEALLRHQNPEALLDAFETWAGGSSDELGRTKALKGVNVKRSHLGPPTERREGQLPEQVTDWLEEIGVNS